MLELVARLDKKDAGVQMRLAEIAEAKKDAAKLEGRLLDALDRDPSLALAHFKLGTLKRDAKVLHEAVEQFQAAGALQGPGSAEGKAEADKILKDFELPKPFGGDVDAINWKVSSTLGKLFEKRVAQKPGLYGMLRVRVSVDKDGTSAASRGGGHHRRPGARRPRLLRAQDRRLPEEEARAGLRVRARQEEGQVMAGAAKTGLDVWAAQGFPR